MMRATDEPGPEKGALPSYADLRERTDGPPRSSWGLFGDVGTLSRIGNTEVLAAAACIQDGEIFNLDWPLDAFDPPPSATRALPQHHIFQKRPTHRDDYLDGFYLQGSSQIDGLRHQAHHEHGFYNGTATDEVVPGGGRLGIDGWAERGIAGRGVLLDVDLYLKKTRGSGLDHRAGETFPVDLLDDVAGNQQSPLRPGDIVMLHTGWGKHYFEVMTPEERNELPAKLVCSGLLQGEDVMEWLWDHGVSLLAADNVAVEAVPPRGPEEFRSIDDAGRLHPPLIALLGLPLGELWKLHELADACASDGRYESMVVSSPLNLRGGVGSPANALAIR